MTKRVLVYPENDAAIGQALSEWLLLKTLADIKKRSRAGADLYTLLGIAADLRLILIDNRPLVHLARARLHLPTPKFAFTPFAPAHPASGWRVRLSFAKEDFAKPTQTANLSGFRRAVCGYSDQGPLTVDKTIKYFANVHGGVHAGTPADEVEGMIQRFAVSVEEAALSWAGVLRYLGAVTTRALEPTRKALIDKPAAPSRTYLPGPKV